MGAVEDAIQAAELIEDRIEKAEKAEQKLNEAVQRLRSKLAAGEDLLKEFKALEARIGKLIEGGVTERIEREVTAQIDRLGVLTEEQMGKTSKKIISEFDRLKDILFGENDDDGRPTVPQIVSDLKMSLQLKWPHFVKAIHAAEVTLRGCSTQDCRKDSEYGVVWLITLPDGTRGESHTHVCAEHREELKKDENVTVIKSYRIDNQMCPLPHDKMKLWEWDDAAGISLKGAEKK